MKTAPVVPASLDAIAGTLGCAADRLHRARALLAGCGLPERWRGRPQFTLLQVGFGTGEAFLASWAAWRDDASACGRLHVVALEPHPFSAHDLGAALAASPWPELANELLAQWPPAMPNLHPIELDGGRVRLLLGFGDPARLAREIVARVDAFWLDLDLDFVAPGAAAADAGAERLLGSIARLAAPDATAATSAATPAAAQGLAERLARVGFDVAPAPPDTAAGDGGPVLLRARHAPRHLSHSPRTWPTATPGHAVIVGAGLAGAATARALAGRGVPCLVLDAEMQPAQHGSGQPAGLYHGTVGADDGRHARLHRAASALAARWARDAGMPPQGLLRLGDNLEAMRALVAAQRLPPQYVQVLDAAQASELAGLPPSRQLSRPAWFYPHGGSASPATLVRHALGMSGVAFRGGVRVHAVQPAPGGGWQLLARDGHLIAEAPMVVLCNADDALRLAGLPAAWVQRVRGQSTWLAPAELQLTPPPRPLASGGYAIALPDGGLFIGATQQPGDDDAALRDADHAHNLARAQRLLGAPPAHAGAQLAGRVGWRAVTRDRLPLVGAAPDPDAAPPTRLEVRFVARRPGLYLHCALGSRGLTTAALGAELIAAQACAAPWPLEADLADAIDPARRMLRG